MKNQIIQRYIDFPKFVNLVQSRALYLSKMSMFEDALEGGLTALDMFKISNIPSVLDLAVNGLWPKVDESKKEREVRLREAEEATLKINERRFQTPFGEYLCNEAEKIFPLCRDWIYVSCWHQSEHECAAMWKLFGKDKNSLCLFSSIEKLEEALTVDDSCDSLRVAPIKYISHAKEQFDADALSPFISKAKPYSFERETRVIAWDSKIDLSESPDNQRLGVSLEANLEILIDKVVISPYADPWFKESVKEFCRDSELGDIEVEDSELNMKPNTDISQALINYES